MFQSLDRFESFPFNRVLVLDSSSWNFLSTTYFVEEDEQEPKWWTLGSTCATLKVSGMVLVPVRYLYTTPQGSNHSSLFSSFMSYFSSKPWKLIHRLTTHVLHKANQPRQHITQSHYDQPINQLIQQWWVTTIHARVNTTEVFTMDGSNSPCL